ncbi:sulfotransferase [Glycomyces sp. NPDC047369]
MVPLLNLATLPNGRQRRDPDRVFDRLQERATASLHADPALRRVCGDAGIQASLSDEDAADFQHLVRSYAAAAPLTKLGWTMVLADLQMRLANQLRIDALHRAIPAIGQEQIVRPIVIVGLPRTASTVTQRVIARSEGHRAPQLSELMHPTFGLFPDEQRAKVREIESMMRLFRRLAPSMRVIHPQYAQAPDEDHLILPHGIQHASRVDMPDYLAWCRTRDATGDYDYLKRVYQVLQHGAEPARWVIKAPCHLAHLDQIVRIFPDAVIVWLHRDPMTLMSSMCSLVETAQRVHVRRPDLHAIGRMCLTELSGWVTDAFNVRADLAGQVRIVDVSYHDIVNNPFDRMPRLYEQIGAQWTGQDEANLGATIARTTSRKHDHGPYRYGLDDTALSDAFGPYMHSELFLRR